MKLIIKEYLSIIKESDELDKLLPTLLLMMNYKNFSKPQKGGRQYGVDIASLGVDEDNIKKLFLFVIKQGDIGRTDWDSGEQAIRPSLNEIIDIYIPKFIDKKYSELPKKIILCTGGDLKQVVEINWKSYIDQHQKEGEIEFDLWDGDHLSILCEKYIFNEEIIPSEYRSLLRKTLVLLDDNDYDLIDFEKLLKSILFSNKNESLKSSATKKKVNRIFRITNLSLNIVFAWSLKNNNLKPALLCAEKTLLFTWEYIRVNKFNSSQKVLKLFLSIYISYLSIFSEYFVKIYKNCFVLDGLSGYGGNPILECLNIYEQLGFVSLYGIMLFYDHAIAVDKKELDHLLDVAKETTKNLINNHQIVQSPLYDNHIIEISIAIYFLVNVGEIAFVKEFISNIITLIEFAFVSLGKYFPISSDSYEDSISLNISREIEKEQLLEISTLIPILAQWCIVLNFKDTYELIRQKVEKSFHKCTLQIWYPDKNTIEYIFKENAARNSGAMDAPFILEKSFNEMVTKIEKVQKNTIAFSDLSEFIEGAPILPFISSRLFRTPIIPLYWQMNALKNFEPSVVKKK